MLDAAGTFERGIGDGLTDGERAIMAGFDRGASHDAIARETGFARSMVDATVALYDDRPSGPRVPPRLVAANQAHAAALRALQDRGVSASRPSARAISVDEIVAMLTDRIDALVADVLPNARREGAEMCVGSLAGEPGQSLRINVGGGHKRGWWKDYCGGATSRSGGNPLYLIAETRCAGDVKQAVQWAKAWLGIDDGGPGADPAAIERHRIEANAAAERRKAEHAAQVQRTMRSAVARWQQAQPLGRGDPVDRYLTARGIDLAALAATRGGRGPGALRYHPALQYGWREGAEQQLLPAMVAQVTTLDGKHVATHRTYLNPRRPAKAGADVLGTDDRGRTRDAKKVMGSPMGGHIPVWKGASDVPLRDVPAGTDVWVSEGIEDALTAACADPTQRVICMIALGYLAELQLPEQMGRLIILRQNDPPGSDAERMLERAIAAHRAAGRRVFLCDPPAGVKDLNDLARGVSCSSSG